MTRQLAVTRFDRPIPQGLKLPPDLRRARRADKKRIAELREAARQVSA